MDVIILNRVREFLDLYRSKDPKAIDRLKELEDFVERILEVTRDKNVFSIALSIYAIIPLYEELIKIRMKIDEIEKVIGSSKDP